MQVDRDLYVPGSLGAAAFNPPLGCVVNTSIAAGANVAATKLQKDHLKTLADKSTVTATSYQQIVHVVEGTTATVIQVTATEKVANIGAATVTVDLLKNGTTILSAVLTRSSADTAMVVERVIAFTSAALVIGDVLEIKFVATAGGGTLATGMFAQVTIREDV